MAAEPGEDVAVVDLQVVAVQGDAALPVELC